MKLFEIVGGEALRRSNTVTTPNTITPSKSKTKDARFLAQGRQGMVLTRPKKMNMVTKVFGFNDDTDGYMQFLRTVVQHQDNVYMPRISNLRVYDKEFVSNYMGDTYQRTGVVDIEKLVPITNPKVRDAVVAKLMQLGVESIRELDNESILYQYHIAVKSGKIQPDEQFEQAIEILASIMDLANADLHVRNIMARLTSAGPQLVLSDPVWDPS